MAEAGVGRALIWEVGGGSPLPAAGTVLVPSPREGARARSAGLGVMLDGGASLDEQAEVATVLVAAPGVGAAEEAADHVRAHALRAPAASDASGVRRSLYATVVASPGALSDEGEREWLAETWSPIDVDGYVVVADGFDGSRAAAEALFGFAHALQRVALRPVVLRGVAGGGLWQAALATGLAGAVAAPPGAGELYHGAILGSVGLGPEDEVLRRRLFFRHGCPCGAHVEGAAPADADAVAAHNRWWFEREIVQAAGLAPDRSTFLLALRANAAFERRARLGLPPLPAAWSTLLDTAAVARAESDASSDA